MLFKASKERIYLVSIERVSFIELQSLRLTCINAKQMITAHLQVYFIEFVPLQFGTT